MPFLNLIKKLKLVLDMIRWPFEMIALLMEIAIGSLFLIIVCLIAAWWTNMIPDAMVINVLNSTGARVLGILKSQGFLSSHALPLAQNASH